MNEMHEINVVETAITETQKLMFTRGRACSWSAHLARFEAEILGAFDPPGPTLAASRDTVRPEAA